jgi:hypothetical protein
VPLVRRLTVRADDDADSAALARAEQDMAPFAARMGVASSAFDIAGPDARNANALRDLMLATLRRHSFTQPVTVIEHDCPHVEGYEEASIKPCSSAEYNLTETAV